MLSSVRWWAKVEWHPSRTWISAPTLQLFSQRQIKCITRMAV